MSVAFIKNKNNMAMQKKSDLVALVKMETKPAEMLKQLNIRLRH